MDSLAKSDIFFFITSIAVVVIAITFTVFLVYMIKVLRDVKDISARVRRQAELISEDIDRIRSETKKEGWQWLKIYRSIANMFTGKKGRRNNKN